MENIRQYVMIEYVAMRVMMAVKILKLRIIALFSVITHSTEAHFVPL